MMLGADFFLLDFALSENKKDWPEKTQFLK
jgi:hypothetical protein